MIENAVTGGVCDTVHRGQMNLIIFPLDSAMVLAEAGLHLTSYLPTQP